MDFAEAMRCIQTGKGASKDELPRLAAGILALGISGNSVPVQAAKDREELITALNASPRDVADADRLARETMSGFGAWLYALNLISKSPHGQEDAKRREIVRVVRELCATGTGPYDAARSLVGDRHVGGITAGALSVREGEGNGTSDQ